MNKSILIALDVFVIGFIVSFLVAVLIKVLMYCIRVVSNKNTKKSDLDS